MIKVFILIIFITKWSKTECFCSDEMQPTTRYRFWAYDKWEYAIQFAWSIFYKFIPMANAHIYILTAQNIRMAGAATLARLNNMVWFSSVPSHAAVEAML